MQAGQRANELETILGYNAHALHRIVCRLLVAGARQGKQGPDEAPRATIAQQAKNASQERRQQPCFTTVWNRAYLLFSDPSVVCPALAGHEVRPGPGKPP